MAFQVMGLAISPCDIKGILIRKKISSIEIIHSFHNKISSDKDLPKLIKQIFIEQKIRADSIVVGIPSQKAVFRTLSLPFNNFKKINKILKFELEPSLPYSAEEVVIASQIRDKKGIRNSDLFAGAIKKEVIDFFCRSFSAVGIDPHFITLDSIGLYNAYIHSVASSHKVSPEIVALIEINGEQTLIVIAQGESLLFTRSITNSHQFSFIKEDTDSAEDFEARKKRFLDSLLEKIDFTLYAFSSQQEVSISKIMLSGEITSCKNACEYFTQKLEVPTSFFDVTHISGKIEGISSSFKNQIYSWLIPLGLVLEMKKNRKNRFNLRQEEFTYQKKYSQYKGMAAVLLLLLIMVGSLLIANITYRTNIRQEKLSLINTKIDKIYHEIFPKAGKTEDELSEVKKALRVKQEKYQMYSVFLQKSMTHLQILKDLSTRVSKDIDVEFIDLSIDKNQIKIKGVADSFESVDRLKNSLQKVKKYAQTVVESAKVKGGSENKVDFRLNIIVVDT